MRRVLSSALVACASFNALAASDDAARLTESYTPLSVEKCIKSNCQSARFGLEDGRLVVKGELSSDEAKAIIASLSCDPGIADELSTSDYLAAWVRHAAKLPRVNSNFVGTTYVGTEFRLDITDPAKAPTLVPKKDCRDQGA